MKDLDPYTVSLKEAEKVYQAKLDSIIADFGEIMIIDGAYGPYIKGPGRRNNVKIPKEIDPKKITREEAEKMLAEKPKSTKKAGKKKTAGKKTRRGKRGARRAKGAKKKQ